MNRSCYSLRSLECLAIASKASAFRAAISVSTRLPEEAIIVAKHKGLHGKLPSSQLINRCAPRQQAIAARRTLALGRVLFSLGLPHRTAPSVGGEPHWLA